MWIWYPLDEALDVLVEFVRVPVFAIAKIIECHFDDMIIINAFFLELLFEQVEKKEWFATTPDTSNDFYKSVVSVLYELSDVFVSYYNHDLLMFWIRFLRIYAFFCCKNNAFLC